MNTPIRRISIAVMVMIVLLMGNLTYIQVVKAEDYRTDTRNNRVLLAEYARKRGQISADGQVLAGSSEVDDRLRFQRQYPEGPAFAPITGYYSTLFKSGGLERSLDEVLNGSDDRLFGLRISDLLTGRTPGGGNVLLTIDPDVQRVAYEELTARNYSGSVVAIRPQTGEILALVSTPSFDPNPLANHDVAVQKKAWDAFNAADPSVLNNRAISEIYPPGSTFKLIDVAAALSSGQFTPDSEFTAAPQIALGSGGRDTLENYNGSTCGDGDTASLREALQRSCNTAFAELSAKLGEGPIRKQAEAFGIGTEGQKIPMSVATSTIGPIDDTAALQQSSIGQRDVALTPLQNAMIVAAIANKGEVMAPYLVKEIQSQELASLETTEPDRIGRAIDENVARTLTELMVNNERSYSDDGKIEGVEIAAKTGTAEHGATPKTTPPHVWYVAFAPADNPQIAVAVLVESGGDRNNLAATGGSTSAPIGRAVIAAGLGRAAP